MKRLKTQTVVLSLLFILSMGATAFAAPPAVPSVVDDGGGIVLSNDDFEDDVELYGDPDDLITGNRGPNASGSSQIIEDEELEWLETFMAWIQGLLLLP